MSVELNNALSNLKKIEDDVESLTVQLANKETEMEKQR